MKKKYWMILTVLLITAIGMGVFAASVSQKNFEELAGWQRVVYAIFNREKLENTRFVGKESKEIWNGTDKYRLENTAVLQKESGRDFVVLNLTDIHMADFDYYGSYNVRLFAHIRALVEKTQPDLITISGDLFSSDSVVLSVYELTDLMDGFGIPWAPIFGNHDDGGNCDLNFLADVMMRSEHCLLQKGDAALGVGNYIINVCDGESIVHSLLMMDSHGDGLHENQIDWYRWAASAANAPSTVILHIPIEEYQLAYDAAWDDGWKEGFYAFGSQKEAICPEGGSNGFFAAVQDIGLTKNILCGHDHTNDFSILYEGVRLSYSMRLGIYGAHHPDNMGATLLTIYDDGKVDVSHIHRYE